MRRKSGWSDLATGILFILLFTTLFLREEVFAKPTVSAEDCLDCHADVWRELKSKMFIHRPDGEGDCHSCHLPAQKRKGSDAFLDQVKWVASGSTPGREHWLEFAGSKRGATLLVEARGGGRIKTQEFSLPPFDAIEELPTSTMLPPAISDVRLVEVNRGVFVSATIAWETDTPADSQVFYGIDKLDHTSTLYSQPVRNHLVMLTGVQPGKIYKYKVVSVNLAGNRGESAVKSALFEVAGPAIQEPSGQPSGKDPEVKVRCYRGGDKIFVVVNADQAVTVRLGIMPYKRVDGSSGEEPMVIRHLLLNTPAVTNIGVCYTCHVEYERILSHPINVYPKRGMIIPPEYATLPDGRITCMSCHANHASNIEFRLIKDRKEELCRGCHRNIQ